jgi:catechol 2,3-dioxygenase-like lactoylglutathione lyase family enzyme
MISRLNVASIYVLDKEEALDFYVNKLGLEKGNDVQQGDYRWLTVRAPGDQATEISLEQPGPPLHDEATAERLRELISKGALGGLVFITDDARAMYNTLRERGVTDSPRSPPSTSTALTWAFGIPSATPSAFCSRGRSSAANLHDSLGRSSRHVAGEAQPGQTGGGYAHPLWRCRHWASGSDAIRSRATPGRVIPPPVGA